MPGDGSRAQRTIGDYPNKTNMNSRLTDNFETGDSEKLNDLEGIHSDPSLRMMGCTFDDQIEWSKFSLPVKSDLHDLLHYRISNSVHPNISINIGGEEYFCHLLVLQCYSTFFERLDRNTRSTELPESHITGRAFQTIYNWMVHPNSDSAQLLNRSNVLEIFMAAQFLRVRELEEQCWAFIDNEELFSEDTAFLLYVDARRLENSLVMDLMVPRIQRFFLVLVSSIDWLQLDVEEVCIFLKSNYICIHCEMEVFMSGVRWLMWDWTNRKDYLLQVMRCVRFGLIAPWQLVDIRRNPESPEFLEVTRHAEVSKMIDDGMAFAIIKQSHSKQPDDPSHWIDLLGLAEPAGRNWAGTEKKYLAYQEFLAELGLYRSQPMRGSSDENMDSLRISEETSSNDNISVDAPPIGIISPSVKKQVNPSSSVQNPAYGNIPSPLMTIAKTKPTRRMEKNEPSTPKNNKRHN